VPSTPDVTVVIPTRDRWSRLSTSALPASLHQEEVDLEVIVVDDASGDATSARLDEIDDPRLRVLRHETPMGVARARNVGIGAARAEWIAFLDDDDLWSPRKLRLQVDTARASRAPFVYGGAAVLNEQKQLLEIVLPPDPDELERLLRLSNAIPAGCSNVLARTDLLRRLDGFDENLFQLADWDLWLRLAGVGRAARCQDVLVGYVRHPENMLLVNERHVMREATYMAAKHGANDLAALPGFDWQHLNAWVAKGHRRAGRRVEASRIYIREAVERRSVRNFVRAVAVLLGERVMRACAQITRVRGAKIPDSVEPDWLDLYR
jgi:glycosyltransferase involved in cell wall biosynthesis